MMGWMFLAQAWERNGPDVCSPQWLTEERDRVEEEIACALITDSLLVFSSSSSSRSLRVFFHLILLIYIFPPIDLEWRYMHIEIDIAPGSMMYNSKRSSRY
jgi:hypothetical protein